MDVAPPARNQGIGRDELLEVLEVFLQASWTEVRTLQKAMAAGDLLRMAVAAHSLKGGALNLGMKEVGHLARRLELAAKKAALREAESCLETLGRRLQDLAAAVQG